jgi:hypothetical protein
MTRDYDPAFDAPEDYGFDAIKAEMKLRSTGRWDWEKAHMCLTYKDADLEPCGQQALELVKVTEDTVFFKLHCGATIVGDDVCLNLPKEIEEDDSEEGQDKFSEIREIYLDQAQEIVCGCGYSGQWSGDDWWIECEVDLEVPVTLDANGAPEVDDIVDAMEAAAQESIDQWEKEMGIAHKMLDVLAGWNDHEGNRVMEGAVTVGSAYWLWKND